jgi:hypothetical protein
VPHKSRADALISRTEDVERSQPESADAPHFDGGYTMTGRVRSRIEVAATGSSDATVRGEYRTATPITDATNSADGDSARLPRAVIPLGPRRGGNKQFKRGTT